MRLKEETLLQQVSGLWRRGACIGYGRGMALL
jgi:hypothetical protein